MDGDAFADYASNDLLDNTIISFTSPQKEWK